MSSRKNILLATLKVHSAFYNHFDQLEYQVDAKTYADFVPYLSAMHPRFRNYMLQIETQEAEESFCLLDQDLNIIDDEALFIKRIKEGDVVHLVPAITGGGGKRMGMFLMLAMGAFLIGFTGGFGAGIQGLLGGGPANLAITGGLGPGGAGGGVAAQLAGSSASAGGAGIAGGLNSMAMRMVGNIAMSVLSRLFAPKPKATERDTSTRDNNMFGSLANSTTSGTPIPLVYGHMRVGGQMLSGYLDAEIHGKSDIISVGDKFD
jgi:predicted phage tail protein